MAESQPPPSRPPEAQSDNLRQDAQILTFPSSSRVPDFGDECEGEVADATTSTSENVSNVVRIGPGGDKSTRGRMRKGDRRPGPPRYARRRSANALGELGDLAAERKNRGIDSISGGIRDSADQTLLFDRETANRIQGCERLYVIQQSVQTAREGASRPAYETWETETEDLSHEIVEVANRLYELAQENASLFESHKPKDDELFHPVAKICCEVLPPYLINRVFTDASIVSLVKALKDGSTHVRIIKIMLGFLKRMTSP